MAEESQAAASDATEKSDSGSKKESNKKVELSSFFAKKARGMMVRYILDYECNTQADLLGFNTDGYQYSEEHSLNEMQPIFIR